MKETEERVWFSHWTDEYIIKQGTERQVIEWLEGKPKIKMDWDNCMVDIAGHKGENRLVLIIRSKTLRNSQYMGNIPVQLRYMLEVEFDIKSVRAPFLDRNYSLAASARKSLPPSARKNPHDRWLLKLGDYEVWQWTEKGNDDIKSTLVYMIYQLIVDYATSLPSRSLQDASTWFRLNVQEIDNLVPVIYQPAVDSLDNFLREVHCAPTINHDGTADIQVSLLFNNEHLRKFALADGLYRWFRKLWYGRTIDIETFTIHFVRDKQDSNYFVFQGIYSGDYDLQYDTIHLDNEKVAPKHGIEFYFNNQYHPVVFVNTSNHAFAAHDNNGRLWKWEYIAWIKGSPVKYGTKTRDELNRQFKSIFSW